MRLTQKLILLVCALIVAVGLPSARANEEADWLKAREVAFTRFQAAHRDDEAKIADLKAKTAALGMPEGAAASDIAAPPAIRRVNGAISELWDNPVAPEMVVVPAGSFTMGSPATEPNRNGNEPQRRVTIANAFAVGRYAVTRDEYAAFVAETKRPDGATCYTPGDTDFTLGIGFHQGTGATWRNPGFAQTGRDPVVCVSWMDAQAYAAWLSTKTGKKYRLLSEAEWEYAARAGTTTARYWGDNADYTYANFGAAPVGGITAGIAQVADRWVYTAPVGSFPPNPFGLYDMIGNASQWVQDCYQANYTAPVNGSALDCAARFSRGAGWALQPNFTRVAYRYAAANLYNRVSFVGFRVARTL